MILLRLRGDMILLCKITYNRTGSIFKLHFSPVTYTRDKSYEMYKTHAYYNLHRYFFSDRVIHIWNSLPDTVVSSDTINTSKNRLDRFWQDQDVFHDCRADIVGIRSQTGNYRMNKQLILSFYGADVETLPKSVHSR
jgi:hypothetical protein